MAVDVEGRKLYMADFEKTGELTGSSSDYEGRIIRTNLDGSQAEVLINEPGDGFGKRMHAFLSGIFWLQIKCSS